MRNVYWGVRHLPLLSSLRVESPCNEDWDAMPGDDFARHCSKCAHDVFDLSSISPEDAEAFLKSRTGRVCVRIDTPSPPPALLLSRARNLAAAVGTGLALAACSPTEDALLSVPNTPDTSIVTLPLAIDSGSPTPGDAGSHGSPDGTLTDSGSRSTRNVNASTASAPKKVVPPKKFDPRGGKTMGVALMHDREF